MTLLHPDLVWLDGALRPGLAAELDAQGLVALRNRRPGEVPDLAPHLLMPACADLQVNGSGGVMLNSDPTPEGIAAILAAQRARGTGWAMPTLITTTLETMRAAAAAVIRARGLPGLIGLHLEGPYLNPARRGTHAAEQVRGFEPELLEILAGLRARDIPVLLTLAPEIVPAARIAEIRSIGVTVSAGHSAASAAEARAGLAAGITCFTHLFNAMPQMQSRAPGIIAAAVNSDAYAGIIADGVHVDWDMLAIACRARPVPGRMFLVSDAMSTIGGPDHFELYGETIHVEAGRLVNAEGSLAGAHTDMVTCLGNMIRHVGIPVAEAVAMAADTPWRVLGLAPPALYPGRPRAEMLALDAAWCRLPL